MQTARLSQSVTALQRTNKFASFQKANFLELISIEPSKAPEFQYRKIGAIDARGFKNKSPEIKDKMHFLLSL